MAAEQGISRPAPVAVVYLARGAGGGLLAAQSFLESYSTHSSGFDHRLYIIAKGWDGLAIEYQNLRQLAGQYAATLIDLPDHGFDWGAYFRVAPMVKEAYICFLNTHSRIEKNNWLALMANAAGHDGVGLVGCTASYGTVAPQFDAIPAIVNDVIRSRGLIRGLITLASLSADSLRKTIAGLGKFPAFPNPHLRSNAFLLKTSLFAAYSHRHAMPKTKDEAFGLESGPESLPRYLAGEGLASVIAGTDGKVYPQEKWAESNTFRVPGQHNLLVSDNQTRYYDAAPKHIRRVLEFQAWGRFISE